MNTIYTYRTGSLRSILLLFAILVSTAVSAVRISGVVRERETGTPLEGVKITSEKFNCSTFSDSTGNFAIELPEGNQELYFYLADYETLKKKINVSSTLFLNVELKLLGSELDAVEIKAQNENNFSLSRLNPVEGTSIYAGKKNEVIHLDKTDANMATNNSRQLYAKIAGLNIWESDGAGLQLGIGGRGLSPNRTSNFNTRQNGYDISADALGYPESYYTPSSEGLERIEIIRGASSLQYGTQFGGVVNFVMKKGNPEKPFEVTARQSAGSFGLYNAYTSIGGSGKKLNYFASYQFKRGDGWRINSGFHQHNVYTSLTYSCSEKLQLSADYTFMTYLAQQAGGLSDAMFATDPKQSIRSRNWFLVNWNLASISLNYRFNSKSQLNIRNFGLLADRNSVGILSSVTKVDPMTERDLIRGNFKNFGSEIRFLQHYSLLKKSNVLLVGGRFYKGHTRNRQGSGTSASDADFSFLHPDNLEGSDYSFPSTNLAVFAENIFYVNEKLTITPGFRLEYINTASSGSYKNIVRDFAGNIIYEATIPTSAQRSRYVPLAGIGVSYKPKKSTEFYANISQNYRAINFSDLQIVNPNYKVNPAISDEYGYTSDIGIRGNIRSVFSYDLSVFYISYKNRIGEVLKSDPNTLQIYRYRTNIADSYNTGIESYFEINFLKLFCDSSKNNLSLFSNLSFIDARYLESEETAISNKKVELVPNITARSGISFRSEKFSSTFQFSYVSKQYSDASNAEYAPNAVSGVVPQYYVMDFSSSYCWKFLKIECGVNNLSNNLYFTRRASGYPGPGILPADGRNFYVALQIKI